MAVAKSDYWQINGVVQNESCTEFKNSAANIIIRNEAGLEAHIKHK